MKTILNAIKIRVVSEAKSASLLHPCFEKAKILINKGFSQLNGWADSDEESSQHVGNSIKLWEVP